MNLSARAVTYDGWTHTMLTLDAIDLRILSAVQRNGRITKQALASEAGLSASPCWTRLRRLTEAGIISGYHARIAPQRVAPFVRVMMEVTLTSHRQADFQRFEQAVGHVAEITDCWAVGGGIDYFLTVLTPDIDSYQRLVDRLLAMDIGIDRYFTYVITKMVKQDATLPLEALIQTRSA